MWLSNTACAAMMIPIACAVLKELDDHRKGIRQRHAGQLFAINSSNFCGVIIAILILGSVSRIPRDLEKSNRNYL